MTSDGELSGEEAVCFRGDEAERVYPIITVAASGRVGDQPMGTKAKFWWRDQAGTTWLFKYARPGTGEHWAEKIAAEVGVALGVPCAEVELAECGEPGSVSRTLHPAARWCSCMATSCFT